MWVDDDLGAASFGLTDPATLRARICAALEGKVTSRRVIIWVERVDIDTQDGAMALFHDEDGTSHLDLLSLDVPARERVIARLEAAGFTR
jgi:hypothetical protein